jgi:hypothetical protein
MPERGPWNDWRGKDPSLPTERQVLAVMLTILAVVFVAAAALLLVASLLIPVLVEPGLIRMPPA